MSRHGYSDEGDDGQGWLLRHAIDRALGGKRGQEFLRDLVAALDELPVKRLTTGALVKGGDYCALGAVGRHRGIKMVEGLHVGAGEAAKLFGIAPSMAAEIMFENDDGDPLELETPEGRYARVRAWTVSRLNKQ
jgi:hypothetical protein